MQIFVKLLSGEMITLEVEQDDTVAEVQIKLDVKVKRMKLVDEMKEELIVYCPHCKLSIPELDLPIHETVKKCECGEKVKKCVFVHHVHFSCEKCGRQVPSRLMELHKIQLCKGRDVTCDHCGLVGTSAAVISHEEKKRCERCNATFPVCVFDTHVLACHH